jgi:integrase
MHETTGQAGCRRRVERGVYLQPNGKYAVCFMVAGKPQFRTVGTDLGAARTARSALIEAASRGEVPVMPGLRFDAVAHGWIARYEMLRAGDARAFRNEIERRQQMGEVAMPGSRTFSELLADYTTRHLPTLEASTQRFYIDLIRAHILPFFGELRMHQIKVGLIEDFRAELEARGVGRTSVRKAMSILQGILTKGVRWEYLAANPAVAVAQPSGARQSQVRPFTPEEIEAARLRLLATDRVGDAVLAELLGYGGLRPEEPLGLAWEGVRTNTLLLERRNIDGELVPGLKGGHGFRTVELLPELRADLLSWRMRCGNPAGDVLILPRFDGEPWRWHDWKNWTRRLWRDTLKEAQVAHRRPYDLRHSRASLLIHEGRSPAEVADQMGHSVDMTVRIYTHLFEEFKGRKRISAKQHVAQARRRAQGNHGSAAANA